MTANALRVEVDLIEWQNLGKERDALRAELVQATSGWAEEVEKTNALRAVLAERQDALVVSDTRWMETRAENERLVAQLARERDQATLLFNATLAAALRRAQQADDEIERLKDAEAEAEAERLR